MKPLSLLAALLLILACLVSCEARVPTDAPAADAAVSFDATVYYARDGRMRFLYDADADMLTAMEGYDMAALYAGEVYSLVLQYTEGTVSRSDADKAIAKEFTADGSHGAVLYGSTDTGFAKVYYLLSPSAAAEDEAHLNEILSTVTFAEFETEETDEDVKIFVD